MNSNDPRSYNYIRTYNKYSVNCIRLVIWLLFLFFINFYCTFFNLKFCFTIILNILYIFLNLKSEIIFFIKMYQHLAPISIRSKCRFEPSCSDYALQVLKKYSFLTGLKKIIIRLKRCNPNDGGYDYP